MKLTMSELEISLTYLVFFLYNVAVAGEGLYLMADFVSLTSLFYVGTEQDNRRFQVMAWFTLMIGIMLTVTAMVAFLAAVLNSSRLMKLYGCLVVMLVSGQTACIAWISENGTYQLFEGVDVTTMKAGFWPLIVLGLVSLFLLQIAIILGSFSYQPLTSSSSSSNNGNSTMTNNSFNSLSHRGGPGSLTHQQQHHEFEYSTDFTLPRNYRRQRYAQPIQRKGSFQSQV